MEKPSVADHDGPSLEEQLAEAKKTISDLKKIIRNFAEHAIDNEGFDWICSLCGKKEPLEVEVKDFSHETWCPMHPEGS
jgi:hypothetical protein